VIENKEDHMPIGRSGGAETSAQDQHVAPVSVSQKSAALLENPDALSHSTLRVAAAQYPRKSPEDQAIERRYMARDLAAVEERR